MTLLVFVHEAAEGDPLRPLRMELDSKFGPPSVMHIRICICIHVIWTDRCIPIPWTQRPDREGDLQASQTVQMDIHIWTGSIFDYGRGSSYGVLQMTRVKSTTLLSKIFPFPRARARTNGDGNSSNNTSNSNIDTNTGSKNSSYWYKQ